MMNKFFLLCALVFLLSACGTPAGFDPALAAQQAQSDAERYSLMATGTAQDRIVRITETGAAISFSMTENSIQATQIAAQWTATPSPLPTITQTATANATTTAIFNLSRAESTQMALTVERAEITNTMRAVWGYTFAVVALFITVLYAYTHLKRLAVMPNPVSESGKAMPMINVVEGTAYDIERATNGMISMKQEFLKLLPAITGERQDQVTARSQWVDMATRSRLPKRLVDEQSRQGLLPASTAAIDTDFLLPAWDVINSWDGKGIPFYTAQGLETIDIERFPHLSVLGATGMGKSRRFIRPLIACALAAGHRVIIVGKSADYFPFESHPNAALIKVNKLTELGQAMRYASILEAIIVEMNRRDDVLTSEHRSTWTHSGRSRTFIILDELGNALRLMDRDTSNQCRLWVEGGVMEGRKVGFNFVIANQRATGMASILSQTGKAIFRVESDEERAHRSLLGASTLHEGYFMARFGAPKIAGAFEPTDDELQRFLASRPVSRLDEAGDWIEGLVSDLPTPLPAQQPMQTLPAQTKYEWINGLDAKDAKLIQMYQAGGFSNAAMEEAAYGYTNGRTARRAKELIEKYREYQGSATTTTTTTPQNGQNQGFFQSSSSQQGQGAMA
jgi:hypothetical protein